MSMPAPVTRSRRLSTRPTSCTNVASTDAPHPVHRSTPAVGRAPRPLGSTYRAHRGTGPARPAAAIGRGSCGRGRGGSGRHARRTTVRPTRSHSTPECRAGCRGMSRSAPKGRQPARRPGRSDSSEVLRDHLTGHHVGRSASAARHRTPRAPAGLAVLRAGGSTITGTGEEPTQGQRRSPEVTAACSEWMPVEVQN